MIKENLTITIYSLRYRKQGDVISPQKNSVVIDFDDFRKNYFVKVSGYEIPSDFDYSFVDSGEN